MALTKINNNTLSAVTTLPAAIATGKVLQVVSTSTTTEASTTSTSWQNTSLTANITPSATSSKILIMTTASFSGTSEYELGGKILRQIGGSDAEILIGDAASSRARTFICHVCAGTINVVTKNYVANSSVELHLHDS